MKLTRPSAWLFRAEDPNTDQPAWKPMAAALADCLAMLAAIGVAAWAIVDSGGHIAAWGALCLAGFAAMVSWVTFGITLGGVRVLLPLYQATAATQAAERQLEFATRALHSAERRLADVEVAMRTEGEALRASTGALTESTRCLETVRDQLAVTATPMPPSAAPRPTGADQPVDMDELERMYLTKREDRDDTA